MAQRRWAHIDKYEGMKPRMSREHFTSDGVVKTSFTEDAAKLRAEEYGLNAYQCSSCDAWHLGNKS